MSKEIKLNSDEYHTLVNAIDDKIYNLTRVINRVNKKNNDVWVEEVNILKHIKNTLKKEKSYHLLPGDTEKINKDE